MNKKSQDEEPTPERIARLKRRAEYYNNLAPKTKPTFEEVNLAVMRFCALTLEKEAAMSQEEMDAYLDAPATEAEKKTIAEWLDDSRKNKTDE